MNPRIKNELRYHLESEEAIVRRSALETIQRDLQDVSDEQADGVSSRQSILSRTPKVATLVSELMDGQQDRYDSENFDLLALIVRTDPKTAYLGPLSRTVDKGLLDHSFESYADMMVSCSTTEPGQGSLSVAPHCHAFSALFSICGEKPTFEAQGLWQDSFDETCTTYVTQPLSSQEN